MYIHGGEDRTGLSFCAFTLDLRARIFRAEAARPAADRDLGLKTDAYTVNYVPVEVDIFHIFYVNE